MIPKDRRKVEDYLLTGNIPEQAFFSDSYAFITNTSDKDTVVYRTVNEIDLDSVTKKGYLHVAFGRTDKNDGLSHIGYTISDDKFKEPDQVRQD